MKRKRQWFWVKVHCAAAGLFLVLAIISALTHARNEQVFGLTFCAALWGLLATVVALALWLTSTGASR